MDSKDLDSIFNSCKNVYIFFNFFQVEGSESIKQFDKLVSRCASKTFCLMAVRVLDADIFRYDFLVHGSKAEEEYHLFHKAVREDVKIKTSLCGVYIISPVSKERLEDKRVCGWEMARCACYIPGSVSVIGNNEEVCKNSFFKYPVIFFSKSDLKLDQSLQALVIERLYYHLFSFGAHCLSSAVEIKYKLGERGFPTAKIPQFFIEHMKKISQCRIHFLLSLKEKWKSWKLLKFPVYLKIIILVESQFLFKKPEWKYL